jgi:hypothetical protein
VQADRRAAKTAWDEAKQALRDLRAAVEDCAAADDTTDPVALPAGA